MARFLETGDWPAARVPIACELPLAWISPSAVSSARDEPPRGRYLLRANEFLNGVRIELVQGERAVWSGGLRRVMPGRSTRLDPGWVREVDPAAEPVVCRMHRSG